MGIEDWELVRRLLSVVSILLGGLCAVRDMGRGGPKPRSWWVVH
jgi:hypothetical protein